MLKLLYTGGEAGGGTTEGRRGGEEETGGGSEESRGTEGGIRACCRGRSREGMGRIVLFLINFFCAKVHLSGTALGFQGQSRFSITCALLPLMYL